MKPKQKLLRKINISFGEDANRLKKTEESLISAEGDE